MLRCTPAIDTATSLSQARVMRVRRLTCTVVAGVPVAGRGNDYIYAPHYPPAVHLEEKTLHVHLREPSDCEITVWHEGMIYRGISCLQKRE